MTKNTSNPCPSCGALADGDRGLCDRCGAVLAMEGGRLVQTGQVCFECGAQMDHAGEVCDTCGVTLQAECESCGESVTPTTRICPKCGADRHASFHEARDFADSGLQNSSAANAGSYSLFRASFPVVIAAVFFIGALVHLYTTGRVERSYIFVAVGIFVALLALFLGSFARREREHVAMPIGKIPRAESGQIEIYRTLNLGRAEHLLSILVSEEIPAVIANRHSASLEPMSLLTGIRVLVPAQYEAEAREIMSAFAFKESD